MFKRQESNILRIEAYCDKLKTGGVEWETLYCINGTSVVWDYTLTKTPVLSSAGGECCSLTMVTKQ
eukprot:Pgem_evm2s1470